MDALQTACEILIIDDASEHFEPVNKAVCQRHTYIALPENIGRARIRNLFLKYARYEYLLFLDCDVFIDSPLFLSNYVFSLHQKPSVVCGGLLYGTERPSRQKRLRWRNGRIRESQPVAVRQKNPSQSFMTSNFLIRKTVFEAYNFDKRLVDYGHEDTLFGHLLKTNNIVITHIDNPVLITNLDHNQDYLNKTEAAVINLIHILNYTNYDPEFIADIRLLQFYYQIKNTRKIFNLTFFVFKPLVRFLLVRGCANLYLFDYYKLGLLMEHLAPGTKAEPINPTPL